MRTRLRVVRSTSILSVLLAIGTAGCAGKGPPISSLAGGATGYTDPTTGMEFVLVKGGCFQMGNTFDDGGGPMERPVHEVCVDDLLVGKYEVTRSQWAKVVGSAPSERSVGGDYPVDWVSWNEVQAFLARMNEASGALDKGAAFRLPTEAEWEFAARSGGMREKYAGRSDDLGKIAWFWANTLNRGPDTTGIERVGTREPNGLGLHDMTGNVWEWTSDWYDEAWYSVSPRGNPTGPSTGEHKVLRGGGYSAADFDLRAAYRNHLPPDFRGPGKGFRVVRPVPGGRKSAAAARAEPGTRSAPPQAAGSPLAAPPTPRPAPVTASDPGTGMEFVFVKGGCYQMGDVFHDRVGREPAAAAAEQPVHEVCVGDFFIGRLEVTQAQWQSVMGDSYSCENDCDPAFPVNPVRWSEIQLFVDRLNARAGKAMYRLPTEAEWEYAARSGGRNDQYAGGNDVDSVAWYMVTVDYLTAPPQEGYARPVGSKAPNALGIYDMSGNVYEVTSDWYDATYYSVSPRDNPQGPKTGDAHVIRGGCSTGEQGNMRVARRVPWVDGSGMTGVRLVRVP